MLMTASPGSHLLFPMKYLLPRSRDIVFLSIFLGLVLSGPRLFNGDGDLGRHITIGNVILQGGGIPTSDTFSHSLYGQPLTPHEWLAQVAFAAAHGWLGLDGVVILAALVVAVSCTLLFETLRRQGTNILSALALTILMALASNLHFLARPHIFTILFLAIWTPLLTSLARGENKRGLYTAPLLMLIWGNTHGAFVAGLIVLAILLAGETWEWLQKRKTFASVRSLLIAGAGSFLALLINPAGFNLLKTSFGYTQSKYLLDHTQEYLSPDFHDGRFLFFMIYLLVMIYAFSRGWKQLTFGEGLLAAVWTALSLYSARNIPLLAVVVTPLIGSAMQPAAEKHEFIAAFGARLAGIEAQLRGFVWPLLAVILVIAAATQGAFGARNSYDPARFPVAAMDWLEANRQEGNMFNYFTWGGYILYREWPQYLVFIDGQTDFYGEALTREYAQVIGVEAGWQAVLDKYQMDWAILPVDGPLPPALEEIGWQIIYRDQTAIILRR